MPRFLGAHLGFRTWNLEGGVLRAAGGEPWINGEPTEAKCSAPETHPVGEPIPSERHSCGLHLFFEPPENPYVLAGVLGAAVAWGDVALQSDGFRAQFALPVGLCKLPTMQVGVYEAARLYCSEWDLPWCETVEELVEEGLRYAETVPRELWTRPDDPDGVFALFYEPAPPPMIRGLKGTALPKIQAARVPFRKAKRRHEQRIAARQRITRRRVRP